MTRTSSRMSRGGGPAGPGAEGSSSEGSPPPAPRPPPRPAPPRTLLDPLHLQFSIVVQVYNIIGYKKFDLRLVRF